MTGRILGLTWLIEWFTHGFPLVKIKLTCWVEGGVDGVDDGDRQGLDVTSGCGCVVVMVVVVVVVVVGVVVVVVVVVVAGNPPCKLR